ncbi:MAG: hypothetical protein ACRCVT_14590 [Leadbetterella sp.]
MSKILHYFELQLRIIKRQFIDFGLHPFLALLLVTIAFYTFSILLFTYSEFANHIYIFLALSTLIPLNGSSRNDFLKFTYEKSDYRIIRIIENFLVTIPFILFLLFKDEFLKTIVLALLSILTSFLNFEVNSSFTMPTPFYRKPFEFIVGFRKSYMSFVLSYFLTGVACIYQNFNLGILSLILTFSICISFFFDLEPIFYVWIYKKKVKGFLFEKLSTAMLFSTLVCIPIIIALIYFNPENLKAILLFPILGYCYLFVVILAKYSCFPERINLPMTIFLASSLVLPFLLLGLGPFFYIQSSKRLKDILE